MFLLNFLLNAAWPALLNFLLNATWSLNSTFLLSPTGLGLPETAGLAGVVAMRAFLAAVMLLINDFFSILIIFISSEEFFSLDILTAGACLRPACLPLTNARAMPNASAPKTRHSRRRFPIISARYKNPYPHSGTASRRASRRRVNN